MFIVVERWCPIIQLQKLDNLQYWYKKCFIPQIEHRNPINGYLGICEHPDEMPQKTVFYQGLHCLLR